MADPASGVITLITFSLVVIRETKKFIQETRDVSNELQRRISQLESFESYMELIEKQCKQGPGCGEELLQCINLSLSRQKPKLDHLQSIFRDLASRDSDTLFQKVKMQIRKKLSEKEVDVAMEELAFHQNFITSLMNIGLYQMVTNINRRTSEVSPTSQVASNGWLSPIGTDYPRGRTFSNDSTVCESPSGIERSPSSPSIVTRSSIQPRKSSASDFPQASNAGKLSPSITPPSTGFEEHSCSSDIHYQINQAPDNHSRLCAVRQILEDPLSDKSLIEIKDEYGRTPLCAATRIGDGALARILILEYGADINATDHQPWSVLEHALALKRNTLVEFLIEQGVKQDGVKGEKHRNGLQDILGMMDLKKEHNTKRKLSSAEPKSRQKKFSFRT